ncbi:MAG: adenosylcobinamide-GDP ribazoletransferase [Victivallales bacterium]|nr:adenosylcobinamide-GDP ribazoletransferase [Victivallales bacterium]
METNLEKTVGALLLSFGVLTRIPVGRIEPDRDMWRRCAAFFPLCGIAIGAGCALPWMLLCLFRTWHCCHNLWITEIPFYGVNLLGAFFYVAALAWITRCLHIDGFCDTCDAFSLVGADKTKRLEVMKDPHLGTSAAVAACMLLVGKATLVFLLLQRHCSEWGVCGALAAAMPILLLIPAAARFSMLVLARIGVYAREGGTGATVIRETSFISVCAGLAFICFFSIFVGLLSLAFLIVAMVLLALLWENEARRMLGGITGDILGACVESAEFSAALVLLLL